MFLGLKIEQKNLKKSGCAIPFSGNPHDFGQCAKKYEVKNTYFRKKYKYHAAFFFSAQAPGIFWQESLPVLIKMAFHFQGD